MRATPVMDVIKSVAGVKWLQILSGFMAVMIKG